MKSTIIGQLVRTPAVAVMVEFKSRGRRDVFLRYPGIRPVALYRDVPPDWDNAKIASYLAERDAAKFAAAGGVAWKEEELT